MAMKLEYVEFHSGDARRNSPARPKSFRTNINITDAQAKGDLLTLGFEYSVGYAPDESYLRLLGKAAFSGAEAKKAHEEWAKTKKITGQHGEFIINAVYYSCAINAVQLSKVFGLLPPVMLPRVSFEKGKKAPAGKRKKK